MAFKTDQIKLKEDYADNAAAGTPVDGTLALIGATGSKELKIRDDGSWVAISGGGGGPENLVELNDVASGPSTEHTVGVVNGAGKLQFAKLSVSSIDSSAIDIDGEWSNSDTTVATTKAVQTYIGSQSFLTSETHSTQNYVKNYTQVITQDLSDNVTLGTVLNQKYVITSNPDGNKFRLSNPATGYTENTIIEIINLSNYDQLISTGGSFLMYHLNTGLDTTNDITIERGQRGLITVALNSAPTPVKYFFVTTLAV